MSYTGGRRARRRLALVSLRKSRFSGLNALAVRALGYGRDRRSSTFTFAASAVRLHESASNSNREILISRRG
jgi:hypothetical protein